MQEADKKRLQINFRELVKTIVVSEIQDYLYEKNVLSRENLEVLDSEKNNTRAARYLVLSILPKKGPKAYGFFCEALRESGYEFLAEKLENSKVTFSEDSQDSFSESDTKSDTVFHDGEKPTVKSKTKKCSCSHKQRQYKEDSCPGQGKKEMTNKKLEDLEFENFRLRKELSFYEERNVFRPKHRNSSDPSLTSKDHNCIKSSRTSFDSGLSDMEDNTNDLEVADGVEDNCDGFTTATVRKKKSRPKSSGKSKQSRPRSSLKSSRSYKDDEDVEEEENLLNVLSTDIVNCMYKLDEPNTCIIQPSYRKYVIALRKAVKRMEAKYESILLKISSKIDLNATWSEIHEQTSVLYGDLSSMEFQMDVVTWGKVITLFTLTGFVAKRCAQKHKVALPLSDFLTEFIEKNLVAKIETLGGWDAFCDVCESDDLNFTCIFPPKLLQPTTTNPSKSAARLSFNTYSNKKLLNKRGSTNKTDFVKTW